ncbi:MAG: alpha/beta hydrolase [Pseudomonadota bacterium]
MASLQAEVLKLALRLMVKRDGIGSREALVKHLRSAMNSRLLPSPLPAGVRMRKDTLGGVRGQWLEVSNPRMVLLYLHGGAFIGGLLETYHPFCGELARKLSARIFLADYRLAPEHPFPAAPDDALAAYAALLESEGGKLPVVMAGDSAGGNLTLVTLLRARDMGLRLPACAVALSPGADATGTLWSVSANSGADAMLSKSMIDLAIGIYLNGAEPSAPHASPARGHYAGFPPLMLTVSDSECLRDDAYLVAQKAREAGVAVQMLVRPDMPHVWPIFNLFLPEAKRDLAKIVRFIERHADHPVGMQSKCGEIA